MRVIEHACDRVAVMYLGRFVEVAPTRSIFDAPQHPYTRALLAAVPTLELRKLHAGLVEGEPPSPLSPPAGCRFNPRCRWAQDRCSAEEPQLREVEPDHRAACHFAEEIREGWVPEPAAGLAVARR